MSSSRIVPIEEIAVNSVLFIDVMIRPTSLTSLVCAGRLVERSSKLFTGVTLIFAGKFNKAPDGECTELLS